MRDHRVNKHELGFSPHYAAVIRAPVVIAALTSVVTLTLCSPLVFADRAPTRQEASAIAQNFGSVPAGCLVIRISTVDASYALAQFKAPPSRSCERYGFDGISVLRRHKERWKPIFEASDYRCAQIPAPARVKRDLKVSGC